MVRHAIRSAAWILGGAALFAALPALACDRHDTADNQFLAYIDFRGMTEAEARAAEREAIDKYHAKQLEVARSRFLRRFQPDPQPSTGTHL